jgi:hypothetical protein
MPMLELLCIDGARRSSVQARRRGEMRTEKTQVPVRATSEGVGTTHERIFSAGAQAEPIRQGAPDAPIQVSFGLTAHPRRRVRGQLPFVARRPMTFAPRGLLAVQAKLTPRDSARANRDHEPARSVSAASRREAKDEACAGRIGSRPLERCAVQRFGTARAFASGGPATDSAPISQEMLAKVVLNLESQSALGLQVTLVLTVTVPERIVVAGEVMMTPGNDLVLTAPAMPALYWRYGAAPSPAPARRGAARG